jgi:molecular chaperone GrpE
MALAWEEDPLVHTQVSAGLFRGVEKAQAALLREKGPWKGPPALFLLPGDDPVVMTPVAEDFARGFTGGEVQVEILEGRRHEPLNDLGREEVLDRLREWTLRHLPRGRTDLPGPPGRYGVESERGLVRRNDMDIREPQETEEGMEAGNSGEMEASAHEGEEDLSNGGGPDPDSPAGTGEGGEESEAEPDAPEEEREDADLLREELETLRDRHLRLAADFENYRKRVSSELASGWTRAQAELAGSLLEGLDDLQRVSQFTSEDATLETLIEGVDLVERKLLKALTGAGLEALDPVGELFDPNTMEAMMRVPTEEEGQEGTVHQVFQKGYILKTQLIRPARVSVYSDDD